MLERIARKPEARILGSDPAPAGEFGQEMEMSTAGRREKKKRAAGGEAKADYHVLHWL